MPRIPRSYIETSFFHVITQGINKSYIFEQAIDIKYYISIMYKLKDEHNIKIKAYCIMNNHAHMLLEADIKELSKYMQRLNTKYAIYYNKKYNRVGYVFRDRFKSEGIFSEQQLYSCINYIYNNPVKAKICNHPMEYPYTNYKENLYKLSEQVEKSMFIDIDEEDNGLTNKAIKTFLLENKVSVEDIKKEDRILTKLIIYMKDNCGISLRKISKSLEISRDKVRYLYKYYG